MKIIKIIIAMMLGFSNVPEIGAQMLSARTGERLDDTSDIVDIPDATLEKIYREQLGTEIDPEQPLTKGDLASIYYLDTMYQKYDEETWEILETSYVKNFESVQYLKNATNMMIRMDLGDEATFENFGRFTELIEQVGNEQIGFDFMGTDESIIDPETYEFIVTDEQLLAVGIKLRTYFEAITAANNTLERVSIFNIPMNDMRWLDGFDTSRIKMFYSFQDEVVPTKKYTVTFLRYEENDRAIYGVKIDNPFISVMRKDELTSVLVADNDRVAQDFMADVYFGEVTIFDKDGTELEAGYAHNGSAYFEVEIPADVLRETDPYNMMGRMMSSVEIPDMPAGNSFYQKSALQMEFDVEYNHVTYDANSATAGNVPVDETDYLVLDSATVLANSDLERTGYTFTGWNTKAAGDGDEYLADDELTISGDITLYAQWLADPVTTYTVTFESNGGTAIESYVDVVSGSTIELPAEPTKADYTFDGWYQESGLTTVWDFEVDTVTSNITLYAKWIPVPKYTVTFESNGGTAVASYVDVVSGSTIELPAEPTKADYTFDGWYQESGLTTVWDFEVDTITSNITLYAKWLPIPKYTVTFESNGGTAVASYIDVVSGSTIELPAEPTKADYIFDGWYQESSLTTVWDFGVDTVTSNITLYAKWLPVPKYTVTFESNGGTAVVSYIDVVSGSTIELPAEPTKADYTFGGWYQESSLTTVWDFEVDTITSNITLYAKWLPVPKYTVTFESNGGTAVASYVDVASGSTIELPAEPTKVDYTFDGWYQESSLTTVWDFEVDTVTSNITLYAKWISDTLPIAKYTVTFESNGGTAVASYLDVITGSTIELPAEPTKADHTFDGWYQDSSLTAVWNFEVDTVTSNITLYAKWISNTLPIVKHTVTFESNGGTAIASYLDVITGSTIELPAEPTKADYTFDGWYQDSSLTAVWNFEVDTVIQDITLYARWQADSTPIAKYTVTFESNGGTTIAPYYNIEAGTLIKAPTNPVKSGYLFVGWYQESTLISSWNFAEDVVINNMTLYAKWTKETLPEKPLLPTTGDNSSYYSMLLGTMMLGGSGVLLKLRKGIKKL